MACPPTSSTDVATEDGPPSLRSARAWELLRLARGLEGAERRTAIERACGDDATLHDEVAALLGRRVHPSLDLRAERSTDPTDRAPGPQPTGFDPADVVPGFRIVRRLGEGGAGVVYEAEQASPKRLVALKIFMGRAADPAFHPRIAHEAEILARLHHPSIAQVYAVHDGHVTGGPPPWIAMELVRGKPIDIWSLERCLGLPGRVELLAQVAEAVAHAHASGIVHRDLKPSNVLVTDAGVPKVVDFGLAKTLDEAAGVRALRTCEGDLVGTIAFMAVEQAQGATSLVDTRTDVHALGVLAYLLLAGRLPRDPAGKSLPEWTHVLARPAPSLREVLPSVPLDLALVVAKALEGDRERRYATAQAFADDLRRYLRSEPILARAATTGYLVRSFVRRHRPLVVGALAAVLALATGLIVSLQATLTSAVERQRADQEAHEARREAYHARTSVASEALAAGNAFAARASLDRAPDAFRGWEWRYLDAQVERAARVVTYAEPLQGWRSVAADGARIAGGTTRGGAVVLDAATGRLVRRLGSTPRIERGALLPDGRCLVLARAGGGLEVVDLASGEVTTLARSAEQGGAEGRTSPCDALAIAPGGALVCESRRDATPRLRLVDLDTGASSFLAAPNAWPYLALVFGPRGDQVAAASADGPVLVWDLDAPGMPRVVGEHSGVAHAAAFLPDGTHLLSGGVDRHLLRLGVRASSSETLALHQQVVSSIAVSDDGRRFASWSGERVLRLFAAEDGRLLASWQALGVAEHACVRFASGGSELEVYDDRSRHVWFAAQDTDLDVLRGHRSLEQGNPFPYVYDVAFSPDGRRVATAGWDGTVRIYGVSTADLLAVLTAPGPVQALAWSRDGTRIAASGRPHHLVLFDAATGRELARADDARPEMVGGIAFSQDDRFVLGLTAQAGLGVRDGHSLTLLRPLFDRPRWNWSMAIGARGVLAGFGDGTWEWRAGGLDGRPIALPPHRAALVGVAISPDGSLAAAASEDGSASLVETASGKRRTLIQAHVGRVYAVAFSPDGTRLATGGDDGTVRLHDTASGEEVLVLRGHASYVHALAFSPDGATLASASGDNTARLWCTRPLAERIAIRDTERARTATLTPRVEASLTAAPTPTEAAAALRRAPDLGPAERAAALDVLLRLAGAAPRPAAGSAVREPARR